MRPEGRPHVTPIAAVWMDGSLYFSTGPSERKAHNIERNARCVVTTGYNLFNEGLDVGVEGNAVRISDEPTLQRLADLFATKYEVAPAKAFSYQRGEQASATRYRF